VVMDALNNVILFTLAVGEVDCSIVYSSMKLFNHGVCGNTPSKELLEVEKRSHGSWRYAPVGKESRLRSLKVTLVFREGSLVRINEDNWRI